MTTKQTDRDEAITELRARLKPGQEILCILRHVSRSGMQRVIDLKVIEGGEMRGLGWSAARALGYRFDTKREGIVVGGCGMDMGFHLVYNLGRALWPDGQPCVGEGCPSNDHSNGDRNYAPHVDDVTRCAACGEAYPCSVQQSPKRYRAEVVAHHTAAPSKSHMHRDGGYALKSRWV